MTQKDNLLTEKQRLKSPFLISAAATALATALILVCGQGAFIFAFIAAIITGIVVLIKLPSLSRQIFIVLLSLLMAYAAFCSSFSDSSGAFLAAGEKKTVSGTVSSYPVLCSSGKYMFTLSDCTVEKRDIPGKICVYSPECENLVPGDKTEFTAYSLMKSAEDGIFYYHNLSSGIYLTALTSESIDAYEKVSKQTLYTRILALKQYITLKFFDNMGQDEASVVNALVTGDKNYLSDSLESGIRMSGVAHIFAVSGMHLSIWTGLFFVIFRQRSYSAFIPNFLACIFVLFYIVLTGFSPSVLRAGIMLLGVFTGRLIRKNSDSLNSLGLSATALLIYEPYLLGNISFLLSFVATLSVVTTTSRVTSEPAFAFNKSFLTKIADLRYKFTNPLMLSFSVMLMTMPVVTIFFGYFSVFSPLSSLVMTPVAEVLMITGGFSLLIPDGNFLSDTVFAVTDFLSGIIISFTEFIRGFDFSIVSLSPQKLTALLAVSGLLYFIIPALIKYKRSFAVLVLINAAVILTYSVFYLYPNSKQRAVYIPQNETDVCISICSFGEYSAVYGSGSKYSDITELSAYLTKRGIASVDYIFLPEFSSREKNNIVHLLARLSPTYICKNNEEENEKDNYSFRCDFADSDYIYSVSEKNFSAAVIMSGNVKLVVCSDEKSDFSEKDEIFTYGDILICEGAIPATLDENKFDDIIILTDKELLCKDKVITNKNNDIEIVIEGDSYAVN